MPDQTQRGVETASGSGKIPLWFYGIGLFLAANDYFLWGVALPISSDVGLAHYDEVIGLYRFFASASIAVVPIVAAAVGLARTRAVGLFERLFLPLGAALFFVGYGSLVVGSLFSSSAPLLSAAGLAIGVSNALIFLLWGKVLASASGEKVLRILLTACIISGSINVACFALPVNVAYCCIGAVIVAGLVFLAKSLRIIDEPDEALSYRGSLLTGGSALKEIVRSFGKPLFCVATLGFAFNATREIAFADFGGPAVVNLVSMVGLLVASVVLMVILKVSSLDVSKVDRAYPVVALCVSACLIPMPFLGAEYRVVFNIVISCIYLLLVTLAKYSMAQVSRSTRIHPYCVFGVGYGVIFAAVGIGTFVGVVPRNIDEPNSLASLLTVALIAVYLLFVPLVVNRRDKQSQTVIRPMDDQELSERCGQVARRFGVTESELAVMRCLARGMTYASTASSLQISENTVRTHSRAIYRKLGIHAKQELIDMVVDQSRAK